MKQEYIDALNLAYASVCQCGHAAKLHAHKNGDSHSGDTDTGACGCVKSDTQAAIIAQAETIAALTAARDKEFEKLDRMLRILFDAHYGTSYHHCGDGDGIPPEQAEEIVKYIRTGVTNDV